eukprot:3634731-Prymnesium_polylepis.2
MSAGNACERLRYGARGPYTLCSRAMPTSNRLAPAVGRLGVGRVEKIFGDARGVVARLQVLGEGAGRRRVHEGRNAVGSRGADGVQVDPQVVLEDLCAARERARAHSGGFLTLSARVGCALRMYDQKWATREWGCVGRQRV